MNHVTHVRNDTQCNEKKLDACIRRMKWQSFVPNFILNNFFSCWKKKHLNIYIYLIAIGRNPSDGLTSWFAHLNFKNKRYNDSDMSVWALWVIVWFFNRRTLSAHMMDKRCQELVRSVVEETFCENWQNYVQSHRVCLKDLLEEGPNTENLMMICRG